MATDSTAERQRRTDPAGAYAGLAGAHVLVVGAAGVGAAAAGHLAAAGTGHVGVMDGALVETSTLARQLLHFTPDVGANRAESLAVKLGFINPGVHPDSYPAMVDAANAAAVIEGHDLVIDCSGPAGAGLLLNRACVASGVALIQALAFERHAVLTVVEPGGRPCLACAGKAYRLAADQAKEAPPSLPGTLGGMLGAAAAAQAGVLLARGTESGVDAPASGTVRMVTTHPAVFEFTVEPDPTCAVCASAPEASAA